METQPHQRIAFWQWTTLVTLLVGYLGYYICRSNLSIASPAILKEFGWDKKTLGTITSAGLLVYALGKVSNGILADIVSSRRMFLLGMVASVACTLVLGIGATFGVFLVAWSCNRFFQSAGWGALVKLASRWFPSERHGTVMAVLCLSYLLGDALARALLSATLMWFERLPAQGIEAAGTSAPVAPWRWMFFVAAAALALIALASWLLLKDSPRAVGLAEPPPNPRNVFATYADDRRPSVVALLLPLLGSLSFWLVLYMSFGLTLVRETFGSWTPTYLVETFHLRNSQAGMASAVIPLIGSLPAVAAGLLADRFASRGRGPIMFFSLSLMTLSLMLLTQIPPAAGIWYPLTLMCAAYFFLIGPYTFLTGVISLDFGGKRGAATAAGLTDAAGYLGGMLAGRWIGGIAQDHGWAPAFGVLTVFGAITAAAALGYWIWHDVRSPAASETHAAD